MNIFYLDRNIELCARYHVDSHVVKMILESTQMLCTVVNECGGESPYRSVHQKHPCTLWVGKSKSNFLWLQDLVHELNEEFRYRFSGRSHQCYDIAMNLDLPSDFPDLGVTARPQCVPDSYKRDDPIDAYRLYYALSKSHIHKWTGRKEPDFIKKFNF